MSTYTVSVFSALAKEKLVQSEDVRLDATSRVQYLPRSAFDEGLVVIWSSNLRHHPLIAGFLVSRGVNVKVMPPLEVGLVSICVNVLAAAGCTGCVKFSEVLVSLVSFTINTESVLNDRAVVYCTRVHLVWWALFCSLYVLQLRSPVCAWWRLPFIWHASSALVSSRHVCCGQYTCTWCLLCTVFLQVLSAGWRFTGCLYPSEQGMPY